MLAVFMAPRRATDNFAAGRQKFGAVATFLVTIFLAHGALASHGDPIIGEEVYKGTCIACHGDNGQGTIPGVPVFTGGDAPLGKADKMLIKNVTNGYESPNAELAMPPKGGNPDLSAMDVHHVIAYLRKAFGT